MINDIYKASFHLKQYLKFVSHFTGVEERGVPKPESLITQTGNIEHQEDIQQPTTLTERLGFKRPDNQETNDQTRLESINNQHERETESRNTQTVQKPDSALNHVKKVHINSYI